MQPSADEPTPEKILAETKTPQRVFIDKETGRLWTEEEVEAWLEANGRARS